MDRLTALLAQYVLARGNFSKSGGGLLVAGDYKRQQFINMTTDLANQLAEVLPIGPSLDYWEALAELASVRLNAMRAARERG